ncbi:hypothetical protein HCU74_17005 [Spongiibacter sp. KMU-166]|uniref:Sodium:neurotransmitter symporter family protein n=1 Tax=Spongiibacter thalassae TaxID=2721624 RepID=A0ABX1GJH6_9GAMM|nr:hypothetical protein [Spongiibacter thalassae]NKI19110.1 hypothetical protein [Spongiibacter thalassae]
MAIKKRKVQGIWSSRWTFLAAATGLVVSLGDFWAVPQAISANGGAAYLLAYLLCLLFVVLPVAVAEVRVAVRARANPVHAVDQLAHFAGASRHWSLVTQVAAVAGLLLAANLGVVAAWLLAYVPIMATGVLEAASLDMAANEFQALLDNPASSQYWHRLFLGAVVVLSAISVVKGMALVLRIVLPVLFLAMLGLLYYSSELGDYNAALTGMFSYRPAEFSWWALLSAMKHAFYTLAIGTGALMAYGAYFPSGRSVSRQLAFLALLDTTVMLLGGLVIVALVNDQHIQAGRGLALMFISLPYTFGNLVFGDIAGTAFFIMVGILVITSVVALLEPTVAYLVERWAVPRGLSAVLTGMVAWLMGDLAMVSLNADSPLQFYSRTLLEWSDIIVGSVLLPLCALCFTLFAAWRVPGPVHGVRDHWLEKAFFWLWQTMLRYIAPPALLVVLVAGLYQRLLM